MIHSSISVCRSARYGFARLSILSLFAALFAASTANAALTFDVRAVAGSQVIVHSPKSVAVNRNSVGGWIDFELWAIVTGDNAISTDDGMQNFGGNMLSTHALRGAAVGDMINSGEVAPRVRRGILSPFDGIAHDNGRVQNLDSDPELEIGNNDAVTLVGNIFGRTGTGPVWYEGTDSAASFPLFRFTMPIESVPAQSLADMTRVHFEPKSIATAFIWWEDGVSYGPPGLIRSRPMLVNDSVYIHTAQTPEELAAIPEPATWLLGLLAIVGLVLARKRQDE